MEDAFLPATQPEIISERQNWAGNIIFSTDKIYYPSSVPQIQSLVKKHHKLKALGSRHCFNRIADSGEYLLSTKNLNKVIALNIPALTVTVEGGLKYGELAPYLYENGFALPNLASLPHISVAGSVITATHGSGITNGNLATSVVAMEFVAADGEVYALSKEIDVDIFNGAVVNLGALGIITKLTLTIEPTFQVQQHVFEWLPLTELKANFEAIVSAGYSVSLFTDWRQDSLNKVWIKSCLVAGEENQLAPLFFGAQAATQNLHPIADVPAENCTEQLGIPGPWHDRLPHFKMGFTPSSGVELQSEYFVPRHQAVEAIEAIARMGEIISPHLYISEIRTIAADDCWMSPCYQQPCVALHFTWHPNWLAVSKILPLIERELAPFSPRPHWGKLFTLPAQVLASRYERLPDFKDLVFRYDPTGKFRNEFLDKNLFGV